MLWCERTNPWAWSCLGAGAGPPPGQGSPPALPLQPQQHPAITAAHNSFWHARGVGVQVNIKILTRFALKKDFIWKVYVSVDQLTLKISVSEADFPKFEDQLIKHQELQILKKIILDVKFC